MLHNYSIYVSYSKIFTSMLTINNIYPKKTKKYSIIIQIMLPNLNIHRYGNIKHNIKVECYFTITLAKSAGE